MIDFIDETDKELFFNKILEINGYSSYDSEKWVQDFISGDTYRDKINETRISSLETKIRFLEAQVENSEKELLKHLNKIENLLDDIKELNKENRELCKEADGYCDQIEYYKEILSCLNLHSLGYEDDPSDIDEPEDLDDMIDPSVMEEEPLDMQDIRRRFFSALDAQEATRINMEGERRERERREHIESILGAIRNNE